MIFVGGFRSHLPQYDFSRESGDQWLAQSYQKFQKKQALTAADYERLIKKVSGKRLSLGGRRTYIADFVQGLNEGKLLSSANEMSTTAKRMQVYGQITDKIMDDLFTGGTQAEEMIHVTCTGYVSPTPVQKMLQRRNLHHVRTLNAYHMGCYAAFPAFRMASSALLNERTVSKTTQVDVVHTELCTLHFDPVDPGLEKMVIQSLFADGSILYRLNRVQEGAAFELLQVYEELIPQSENAMSWSVSDFGFFMSLSREVPELIESSTLQTLNKFCRTRGYDLGELLAKAIWAIHPGGPKIIDSIQKLLRLSEEQTFHSHRILNERGNMSSATLPHIWQAIAEDAGVAPGTPVVSLAFGPGLTLCMSLMRKVG